MLVAGAGPVSNFVLAGGFTGALFMAARTLGRGAGSEPVLTLLATGVLMNVALGVFNLVPLPPLDGFKVAAFGLPRELGEAYDRIVRPYGMWILLILFVSGALSSVVSPVIVFLHGLLFWIALP